MLVKYHTQYLIFQIHNLIKIKITPKLIQNNHYLKMESQKLDFLN